MTKYIFVTGGVVSGVGKGLTTASIGTLLKSNGLKVDAMKVDPYLNIDPGTMSPQEHGEVFVLEDGTEADMDLGMYERFLDTNLSAHSSKTAGKIYNNILQAERNGDYLGKTVQLIPHVTNYIKRLFGEETDADVRLIEIGASTGDYEQQIFLESFRQFDLENKENVFHIHLTYIPFLKCSGEFKTKPMQISFRELLRSGLQPDLVILRSESNDENQLGEDIIKKVALFSNLDQSSVISLPDQDSIYEVPLYLLTTTIKSNLELFLQRQLQSLIPPFYERAVTIQKKQIDCTIAIVGKYVKQNDAYASIIESIRIAGVEQDCHVNIVVINAESTDLVSRLDEFDGIIIPGGFGKRGMDGKISAAQHARLNNIPFLGICLGLQMAVVEFARNVCGLDAVSREMYDKTEVVEGKAVVIDFMPEQMKIFSLGGTMRLGSYSCTLTPGTIAYNLYNKELIYERHRHRLEVANAYVDMLTKSGLVISGRHFHAQNQKDYLVELIELPSSIHPYYIATQSHPEFLSRPGKPHPLFKGLIQQAFNRNKEKRLKELV